jgi:hypothetical protein
VKTKPALKALNGHDEKIAAPANPTPTNESTATSTKKDVLQLWRGWPVT